MSELKASKYNDPKKRINSAILKFALLIRMEEIFSITM